MERARAAGEVRADLDARTEVVLLLALANGLTASVLGRERTTDDALRVLRHQLDRVLAPTTG
ncbi:hypothetical protein [Modestobacter excelsi]|uniref:hypothetical protein n=1 Tax=Modestobacter excelsi TaxID=2213161 RepID=UPI00110CDB1B|nr:hypothetical protein [Modestobacter excelsi]